MVVKKILRLAVAMLAAVLMLSAYVSAEDTTEEKIEFNEEYRDMLDALPEDIAQLLPEKLYSDNASDIVEGAKEVVSFGYIVRIMLEYLGLELASALKILATLIGRLVLAATLNALKASFSSVAVSEAFSICASCAVFLTAVASQYSIIESVVQFFKRLSVFVNAMIPLMSVLYAMGGNVAGAVVNHSSLMIFMTILENLCAATVMPVAGICIAFSAAGALAPNMGLGGLSGLFKKMYTNALTFTMTVFTTVMAAQSLLASKADGIAGKAAKFAVGNLVPLVGSALAGTLGTVSTSIEYIRSGVGVVGIVVIILMLLPTLLTLLVTKYVFSLAAGAADILGCGSEKKIISEMAGVNGFLMASACICSVTLIFMLTIFAKCSAAAGG